MSMPKFTSLLLTIVLTVPAIAQTSGGGGTIVIPPNAPPAASAPVGGLAKYEPSGDRVYHGASLENNGTVGNMRNLAAQFAQASSKKLAVVTWFASTYENGRLTSWNTNYAPQLNAVKQIGAISMIKFSVQDANYEGTHRMAGLREITAGVYDAYFQEMGDTLRNYGGPVFLSINHEMNGTWYPYSEKYPGSGVTAADWVASYRHIVDVLRQRGASNVAFVWSPNVPDVGGVDNKQYYPGDDYTDWIGVSFYSGNPVDNLSLIYRTYAAKKPFFINEWATSPQKNQYYPNFPGEAVWVRDVLAAFLQKYPRVKAITWFEKKKADGDHLLERVPAQQQVYAQAIQNPRYLDDANAVVALPATGGQAPVQIAPREVVLPEYVPREAIKTETVKTEAPGTIPARAPLKLQLLPRK